MDYTSQDPLDYLKTLAECAEQQRAAFERQQKFARAGLVVALLVALITPLYVARQIRGASTSGESKITWASVCSAQKDGDLQRALGAVDQMLTRNPGDFEGHYKRGEILLMLGDRDEARKSFQTASDLFPIAKYKSAVEALTPPKPKAANSAKDKEKDKAATGQ